MFRTQQGRTLCNDEMDVDEMTRAVGGFVEVTGYEPAWRENVTNRVVFHVSTRHVVEWWEPQMLPKASFVLEAWSGSHA